MALDAKQKALLLQLKQAVKADGLSATVERLGMYRQGLQAVIADTARESTVLLALDKFAKAPKA